jgi:hypothetical protein
MIHTVITADKNVLILPLPEEYVGKQVEVIAFTLDEVAQKQQSKKKHVTFDAVKLDTRGFKFNRDEANER